MRDDMMKIKLMVCRGCWAINWTSIEIMKENKRKCRKKNITPTTIRINAKYGQNYWHEKCVAHLIQITF